MKGSHEQQFTNEKHRFADLFNSWGSARETESTKKYKLRSLLWN